MRDLLLGAVIACLTLAVPVIGYMISGNTLLQQSEDAMLRAQRFDAMARSVEDGKVIVHKDSVAASLRHYASAERALSRMHLDANTRANHVLLFMACVALCQFALLYVFISSRRSTNNLLAPAVDA